MCLIIERTNIMHTAAECPNRHSWPVEEYVLLPNIYFQQLRRKLQDITVEFERMDNDAVGCILNLAIQENVGKVKAAPRRPSTAGTTSPSTQQHENTHSLR